MGKVWLVGAGPGDISLLTLKGLHLIKNADVVVYDKLVGDGILSLIPDNAEKIYVGKVSGNHAVAQERINEILLEKALEDKKVVRLKGGDPFLFGRGGEELELLVENNIEFEIVPGITSPISVPAYAGIPVTHRDFTSSLHIITGHTKKEDAPNIDFEALVKLNGTLVFLMGVSSLEKICKGLIKSGIDINTPAAIIQNGTRHNQRKVVSTVENLPKKAREENIGTPGLIIIGKVAALSNKFSWVEKRELHGINVLVCRQKHRESKLYKSLLQSGANALLVDTIETKPINSDELYLEIKNINKYKWVLLTSPTAVKIFFDYIKNFKVDIRSFYGIKFGVVGPSTGKELEKWGIIPDFTPSVYNGQTLATEIAPHIDGKVLIPRSKKGSSEMLKIFDEKGIKYKNIDLYDTFPIKGEIESIKDFDYITFTSASNVKGFVGSIKCSYKNVKAICIGHETEKEAKKWGFETYVAKEATIKSMIDLIKSLRRG